VLHPESVDFEIESLAPHHEREARHQGGRAAFRCGNEGLDRYLHATATQDKKRNIAIPYVIFDKERQKIIGYYTLSMSGINLEELPQDLARKLPKYPIMGVNLIGRLAVSNDYRGYGWGKLLIMDALHRSLGIRKAIASFTIVVEAVDDEAVRFYQRFDFQAFPERAFKLFRTMTNIERAFDLNSRVDRQ
jgi:predicted GNAT family N-acyltransferase